jgi:putative phosphoribosyl transferase
MKSMSTHPDLFEAGDLTLPAESLGLVVFAHGSGSSHLSPRYQYVARRLQEFRLGTFLFDLLTEDEAKERLAVFDVEFLARRLRSAVDWLEINDNLHGPIGFFGASTGAGAALWAASELGEEISAVVSRGGRPDLALSHLRRVLAPTLLIVGEKDRTVLSLNRTALNALPKGRLEVISGTTHLLEEQALEKVVDLAGRWFSQQFHAHRRAHAA